MLIVIVYMLLNGVMLYLSKLHKRFVDYNWYILQTTPKPYLSVCDPGAGP